MGARKTADFGIDNAIRVERSQVLQALEGTAVVKEKKMSYQKVYLLIAR
jgi:hypothetical protein